ncbi:MAG: hypothetical protein U5O15_07840 [Candidatus Krumholzibacteriota bacterium]|nr:hypothetical protein [Candidatus Krumholzibacteriota bacterium]
MHQQGGAIKTGIRILKILTNIILPLAAGVPAVYLFWFVPAYFRRPFCEREVLIVYNASIMAIPALLTVAVSRPFDELSGRRDNIFRCRSIEPLLFYLIPGKIMLIFI